MTRKEFLALPLSRQLRLAVEDMRAARRAGVKLGMLKWIEFDTEQEVCSVCMAGAVFVQRFCETELDFYGADRLAHTLNDMRSGDLPEHVPEKVRIGFRRIVVSNWKVGLNRATFIGYLKAAKYLESEGF